MSDVFFDLETKELLDTSLEDQTMAIRALHFSVGASWCDCHKEVISYRSDAFSQHLLLHDRIIGFGIRHFDNAVLAYQAERSPVEGGAALPESPEELKALLDARSFDLQLDLEMRLGYKLSLAALAAATLSKEKLGSAALAVIWYRLGARLKQQYSYALREAGDAEGASRVQELGAYFQDRLERYCAQDAQMARGIFEFGVANRRVAFHDFEGERRIVKVDWK